ncbi:MAG: peptidase C14, partial [Planctomycetes bacterium]|nr:peptidase C14 [Planctomycetota bacterium]
GNNEPVTDIWVQVNGRRLDYAERGIGTMNKESKKIDGPCAEIDVTVFLSVRNNHIEVIASNSNGESVPETINVVYSAEELFKPDLYVLSIGVSNYTDETSGLGKLDYAHEDASAISRVFDNQEGQLYRNVHKRLLINEEANRVNILGGLNWLLKESTQKDTAVIFIAGHGINDERGNYYFLPYDGKLEKPWENGVKWFDFQDIVTSLPSKVVLMVDTCHSGSITGKRRGAADITNILRDLVNAESGVVVMAASTGNESSQESREWGHGAFTKALLEGLGQEKGKADADYDKDTAFTIKELDLFVTTRVKDLTDGTQHPTTEISKTLPNFPLSIKQE